MDMRTRVRAFVLCNFYVPDAALLGDDVSLVDTGIVDSTGMFEVIDFVERELGIVVGEHDVVPENFDSITRIAAYIERKAAA